MTRLPCWLALVAAGVLALLVVPLVSRGRVDAARDNGTPPTPTPVAAPASMEMAPRGSDDNVIIGGPIPLANVFVCHDADADDEPDGLCDLEGEGRLVFVVHGRTSFSPLGAFALRLTFDDTIFDIDVSCVTSQDPAPACTGDEDDDGIVNTDADTWDIRLSQQLDNDPLREWGMDACYPTGTGGRLNFGCASAGPFAGLSGTIDLVDVTVRPQAEMADRLANSGVDGVVRVVGGENCMMADPGGSPVAGSIAGGVTAGCGDLAVTVRVLAGDVNLDCRVDLRDIQASAQRYGAVVGDLLYDARYDLEPDRYDFDIDAKDVQRVAGRITSTCQHPLPPQPPIDPTVEG